MKNRKKVLSAISIGLITLGTIGFSSIPYYDSKIDRINEHREETLFNQSTTVDFIFLAISNNAEANIILDHTVILKKLNASKQMIEEKKKRALRRFSSAAKYTTNAARYLDKLIRNNKMKQ